MDDLAKLLIGWQHESHQELIARVVSNSHKLEKTTQDNCYAVNRDKAVTLLGFQGGGAHTTRPMCKVSQLAAGTWAGR